MLSKGRNGSILNGGFFFVKKPKLLIEQNRIYYKTQGESTVPVFESNWTPFDSNYFPKRCVKDGNVFVLAKVPGVQR